MAHTIRLTGHWTARELAPGRVRHSRRFGSPRTLDAGETVWLVGTAPAAGSLYVNGELAAAIVAGARFEVEIQPLLKTRNEVWIELHASVETPLGDVSLEIRS